MFDSYPVGILRFVVRRLGFNLHLWPVARTIVCYIPEAAVCCKINMETFDKFVTRYNCLHTRRHQGAAMLYTKHYGKFLPRMVDEFTNGRKRERGIVDVLPPSFQDSPQRFT